MTGSIRDHAPARPRGWGHALRFGAVPRAGTGSRGITKNLGFFSKPERLRSAKKTASMRAKRRPRESILSAPDTECRFAVVGKKLACGCDRVVRVICKGLGEEDGGWSCSGHISDAVSDPTRRSAIPAAFKQSWKYRPARNRVPTDQFRRNEQPRPCREQNHPSGPD